MGMIMGRVIIDYSEITGSAKSARTAAGCFEAYAGQLERKVSKQLTAVPGPDSQGNISSAQSVISSKVRELRNKKTYLTNLAGNIERMAVDIESHEKKVVSKIKSIATNAFELKNQSKWDQFTQWLYGTVCVDLVNWNPVTRAIANTVKKGVNWVKEKGTKVVDWFKHGEGRYLLGIVKDVLSVADAAIKVVTSVALAAATVSAGGPLIVAAAATVLGTAMLIKDAKYSIANKWKAFLIARNTDDPGRARFYGDINGFNDMLHKTDMGGKSANDFWETIGDNYDRVHKGADFTAKVAGFIGSASLTGERVINPITGKHELVTISDKSVIKENIKGMFMEKVGFKNRNGKWTFNVKNLFSSKHPTGTKARADIYTRSGLKRAFGKEYYEKLKRVEKIVNFPGKVQKTADNIETVYSSYTTFKDKTKSLVNLAGETNYKIISPVKNFKSSLNRIIDFAM